MSSLLPNLRDTNLRLHLCLDSMVSRHGSLELTTPDRMSALLSELSRAGAELRAQPLPMQGDDPELDAELEEYRHHIERLRDLLPAIHGQLLAERGRLEAQRTRVQSTADWALASRQTL